MSIKITRTRAALAVLATAVAVTGVSYAAIPSANGTISACKDNKGALKVIDAEAGQTCGANQQLLTWNQQGPAGQDGFSGYQIVTAISPADPNFSHQAMATCPVGKKPVGGGGAASDEAVVGVYQNATITMSAPVGNGWYVVARQLAPSDQSWRVKSWVICAYA